MLSRLIRQLLQAIRGMFRPELAAPGKRAVLEVGGKHVATFREWSDVSEDGSDFTLSSRHDDGPHLRRWVERSAGAARDPAARSDGSLRLFDESGTERSRWNFKNGWPSAYTGRDLYPEGEGASEELVTLTHDGMTRVR